MKKISLLAFLLFAFATTANAEVSNDDYNEITIRLSDVPADGPRFDSFRVPVYKGPNGTPDLTSDSQTRMYRTRIKEWAKAKPNFAGHYILATWGCGTECLQITIIDAKTGKVFHPSGVTSNAANNVDDKLLEGKPRWPNEGSIKFQANSKLLMLFGMPEEDTTRRGIYYFVWRDNRLSLVRFVPKAWYQ